MASGHFGLFGQSTLAEPRRLTPGAKERTKLSRGHGDRVPGLRSGTITSEVMARAMCSPQDENRKAVLMSRRFIFVLVLFLAFTAYSLFVSAGHGPIGFVDVAIDGGWGTQVFLDLVIACSLFLTWMVRDAKERGLAAWPFVLAVFSVGSIGSLLYLVVREYKAQQLRAPAAA